MINASPDRRCTECGQRIAGRTDKKFCNDQCRTSWHNKQYGVDNERVRNVNNILRKNWRILAELTANGSTEIPSVTLTRLGFKFGYFTGTRKGRNGSAEHFCYDQCFIPVANGLYLLKTKRTNELVT
jgi:predicted nucleic acid-binding Zn ribbon protein